MLITLPHLCLTIFLMTSLVTRKTPLRLVLITSSQSSSDILRKRLSFVIPALFTSIDMFISSTSFFNEFTDSVEDISKFSTVKFLCF